MNLATHGTEGSPSAPVLYMALELSNKTWRLALSDGAKRRQVTVPAADLMKLACAVATSPAASSSSSRSGARSLADQYIVMERGEILKKSAGANMEKDGVKALLAV